jgi:hypothetical protein
MRKQPNTHTHTRFAFSNKHTQNIVFGFKKRYLPYLENINIISFISGVLVEQFTAVACRPKKDG